MISLSRPTHSQLMQAKQSAETGNLTLVANGEDFVRNGFTSKDNWQITFDHIYVTLTAVKAYQTEPPFDPHTEEKINPTQTVTLLENPKTVDLAAGNEEAPPIIVSEVEAPPGHYNALSWKVVPSADSKAQGNTIVLQGTATKAGQTINFNIGITEPLDYVCGEFVGEDRKGIVKAGNNAEVETTFHFDHIFGDAEMPADDSLNTGAVGFGPLAALAQDNQLNVDMTTLQKKMKPQDYQKLQQAIAGLGHVGEGHCR